MTGSPYEKLSKFLIPILRCIQGRSGMYLKNSTELKEKVKHWRIERNEIIVSYDVKKLYPSIPIKETLQLTGDLLRGNSKIIKHTKMSVNSIMKLLTWIFKLTYCEFEENFYILDSGPIGLGVTGELAIIYMEEFQLKVKNTIPIEIKEWYWYVDDSELKCVKEDADKILTYINEVKPGVIEFTKEEEEENLLAVLDLKQTVDRKKKKINFTVNYKTTHTNINVKEQSNHPDIMKRGIIKGFVRRAEKLCDKEELKGELKNIEDTFVANGYKRDKVKMDMKNESKKKKERTNGKEFRGAVRIPYLKGISENFQRIMSKHNIRTIFLPGKKIKAIKNRAQTPLGNREKEIVYEISCKCENSTYIGETWRRAETREKEHRSNVRLTKRDIEDNNLESAERRMNRDDGGLPKHTTVCDQGIDWENIKVLANESGTRQRKVREGIESLRAKHNGKVLLNTYDHLEPWQDTLETLFSR